MVGKHKPTDPCPPEWLCDVHGPSHRLPASLCCFARPSLKGRLLGTSVFKNRLYS